MKIMFFIQVFMNNTGGKHNLTKCIPPNSFIGRSTSKKMRLPTRNNGSFEDSLLDAYLPYLKTKVAFRTIVFISMQMHQLKLYLK